ncbi:hypothetical protein UMM65_10440 [Aureibaculum sp. 2210JD6-5]|uniref:hypothetical protein n=1 Tax=Aureibaculum sp. 2210JD6-5 TaxID=3103957 RepID=UPI002AAD6120|nr:hypothetical protein [Aureibaculum sp. 2210JD6-5]MDY7395661.1 hypothetical protein [Aureibaculum sp. 2210JD6-5]
MKIWLQLTLLFFLFASCDSVVFKEPLPTYDGKSLAVFPEEMRGTYVDKNKPTDSLAIGKTVFIYKYKSDSVTYKSISGILNKDTYAKNYKSNLFLSKKSKSKDYYFVRNIFLNNGNLLFYKANAYKGKNLLVDKLVFDYYYDKSDSKHILKPTNKELDNMLVNNVFVLDKTFVPIKNNDTKPAPLSKNGCISGNCTDGYGYYRYENGYYKGFFENGKRHGYGYYSWNDGQFYFGDWKDNQRSGYGEHFYTKTSFYIGEWKNNLINGYGYKKDKNGKFTRAIWQKEIPAFKFGFEFNKTNKGCAYGDCEDGYGRLFFDNGHFYTGFFRNGKPFLGEYNFTKGQLYRGEFDENWKFKGSGYFLWKNKSYYRGEFDNGQKQGLGFYRNGEDRTELKGEWKSDKLVKSY